MLYAIIDQKACFFFKKQTYFSKKIFYFRFFILFKKVISAKVYLIFLFIISFDY